MYENDDALVICVACGTQYSTSSSEKACFICEDPRQFIPPSGQAYTTLGSLKAEHYRNEWTHLYQSEDKLYSLWSLCTTPKFGIGQRAFFLKTPHGNILWDLIAFLDDDTVEKIQALGGLAAIVISHPHYYTTYVTWTRTFKCLVYVAPEDSEWMSRMEATDVERAFITNATESIVPGITAIKCGGHFPGSLVLHWTENQGMLFIADTIVTVPSGLNPSPRLPLQSTYTFMWSIPNMIPMSADDIHLIWKAIKPFRFRKTFGAFNGLNVEAGSQKIGEVVVLETGLEQRLLDSMKIVVRGQLGMSSHPIFEDTVV